MNPFDLKVMKENVSLKRVRSKTLQLDSRAGALRSEIYVNGCC